MDVEESTGIIAILHKTRVRSRLISDTDAKDLDVEDKETDHAADGALRSTLSLPIPKSLLSLQTTQLPTPPPSPPTFCVDNFPSPTNHADNARMANNQLFYHFLGCATDIAGFDDRGDLVVNFGT